MDIARVLFFLVAFSLITVLSLGTSKIFSIALKLPSGFEKLLSYTGVLFPIFFVGSMILGNYSHGVLARIIYTVISTIAGFYFYFLLGAGLLAIAYILGSAFNLELPMRTVAISLSILSFLLGSIGVIQSLFIRTVTYDIEGVLPEWSGKKAILLADTHFGLVNQRKLSERTVEEIRKVKPDLVFIAGDFFDGPDFNLESIAPYWGKLANEYKVFYAPGNHEGYGDYGKFISFLKNSNVIVLEDELIEYNGVKIVGYQYRGKGERQSLEDVTKNLAINSNESTIAINHSPILHDVFSKYGFNLVLSGHSHRGQFWPINFITRAIYGKFHYGYHSFENTKSITTSGVGTAGPPLRLFNPPEVVVLNFK